MPFYDYKCLSCGKTFEVRHGMNEVLRDLFCTYCGDSKAQRVFSSIRFIGASSSSCNTCADGVCSTCNAS